MTRKIAQWNVYPIGFGGMPLSLLASRPSEADAIKVLHAALDVGINLWDTADAYCIDEKEVGHNERLFGKAIAELPAGKREKVVPITKCGLTRPEARWDRDGSAKHVREATEASLKNLRVSAIPIQQYHRIDPNTPVEETYGELMKLQKEGKILHIGSSNHSVAELTRVLATGAKIVSLQNQYSRKHRNPEFDGTLQFTRERGIAFLPWSPLDGMGGAKDVAAKHAGIAKIAQARGISPHRVALAWLLAMGPHVIPIPGTTKIANAQDCAAAASLTLTKDELALLAAETPMQGAPHS